MLIHVKNGAKTKKPASSHGTMCSEMAKRSDDSRRKREIEDLDIKEYVHTHTHTHTRTRIHAHSYKKNVEEEEEERTKGRNDERIRTNKKKCLEWMIVEKFYW